MLGQTDSTKYHFVNELTEHIYSTYLDYDIAKVMCDTIKYKLLNDEYDSLLNIDEFVYEVNMDLRKVSKDNHINIIPAPYKPFSYSYKEDKKKRSLKYRQRKLNRKRKKWERFIKKYYKRTSNDMFTYGEIKILPGNIGYVEIKDFNNTSYSKKENRKRVSINSVFTFFKNTNSIIVDFRDNLGGKIFLSAKFCSYFTDKPNSYFITTESVFRYDSNEIRKEYRYTNQYFTDSKIDNTLIGDKEIYVLTSKRTFSAAELSAYKLRQINKKTTIIGESTTGGGNGHLGSVRKKFYKGVIPTAKAFDEINSNYTIEATGVKPDIHTNSDSAFLIAYGLALSLDSNTTKSKVKYLKKNKIIVDEREGYFRKNYEDYIGDYRKIIVTLENGKLFMTYDFYSKQILIPDAIDYFITDRFEFVRFMRDKENKIIEIQIKRTDGYLERYRRL